METIEWYELPFYISVPSTDQDIIEQHNALIKKLHDNGETFMDDTFPHNIITLEEYISTISTKLPIEVIYKFLLLSPQQFVAMLNSEDNSYRLITENEDDFLKARLNGDKYFFTRENVFRGLEENYYILDEAFPMISSREEIYTEKTIYVDYRDFYTWCEHNYELLQEWGNEPLKKMIAERKNEGHADDPDDPVELGKAAQDGAKGTGKLDAREENSWLKICVATLRYAGKDISNPNVRGGIKKYLDLTDKPAKKYFDIIQSAMNKKSE